MKGGISNLFDNASDGESPGWSKARLTASAAEILKTPRKPEEGKLNVYRKMEIRTLVTSSESSVVENLNGNH